MMDENSKTLNSDRVTSAPAEMFPKRIIKMIRRPRHSSFDHGGNLTEPRSYSVIRRVRRLQTKTSPILNSSLSSSTTTQSSQLSPRQVFVVRKRKVLSYQSNEANTRFEEPTRIKYIRRVRKYEESRYDPMDLDDVQKPTIMVRRENTTRRSYHGLGGLTIKCTKLCLLSSIIASLLTAALVAAIIIPVMMKWKESSTQTSSTIATTACPDYDYEGGGKEASSLSFQPLEMALSSSTAKTTTHSQILRNLLQKTSHQQFMHGTLQLTLDFLSATNSNLKDMRSDSKNCTTQCDLRGSWTIPNGSEVIGYHLSFIENN